MTTFDEKYNFIMEGLEHLSIKAIERAQKLIKAYPEIEKIHGYHAGEVTEYIEKFNNLKPWLKNKDIYGYENFDELCNALKEAERRKKVNINHKEGERFSRWLKNQGPLGGSRYDELYPPGHPKRKANFSNPQNW